MSNEATMVRRVAALVLGASLVIGAVPGVSAASPADQARRDRLACSVPANGGRLVEGVCVLPRTNVGQIYEAFIVTTRGDGGLFSVTAGSLPPGTSMPARYGAAGTIVGGTPTAQGRFTFTVKGTDDRGQALRETYEITVGAPLPFTISFPARCCNAGAVDKPYLQDVFFSGGLGPVTTVVASGQLPPGLALSISPSTSISGTPTVAGKFAFELEATDALGARATKAGVINVS
jgi:large repetitive protein